jgi:lipopolysaccharide export system protein LptA
LLFVVLFSGSVRTSAGEEKAPQAGTPPQPTKQASPFSELSLTSRNEPIHIRSQNLEFLYKEKRIVFRGAVVATQGDATLKSDTLTVTYEEQAAEKKAVQSSPSDGTPSRQQIKEITAEDNVEITSNDRRATCKKAVFNDIARTAVLVGNAVLREGANEIRGERVTVYLDEGRSVVEGGPGKIVEMELIPRSQENSKKGGRAL